MPHRVELVAGTGFVLQGQPQNLQEALQVEHGHVRQHPTLVSPVHCSLDLWFSGISQLSSHLTRYLSNENNILFFFLNFFGEDGGKNVIVLGVKPLQGLRTECSTCNFWIIAPVSILLSLAPAHFWLRGISYHRNVCTLVLWKPNQVGIKSVKQSVQQANKEAA